MTTLPEILHTLVDVAAGRQAALPPDQADEFHAAISLHEAPPPPEPEPEPEPEPVAEGPSSTELFGSETAPEPAPAPPVV